MHEFVGLVDFTPKNWESESISRVASLENKSWAPWLRASEDALKRRMGVFPEGQFALYAPNGELAATLSTVRINCDNPYDKDSLPNSWDTCAGVNGETNLAKAHVPDGNTLVLLSMNIDPKYQGKHLSGRLIDEAKKLVQKEDMDYIISPFRPLHYGMYKLARGYVDLADYAKILNEDGFPVDPWFRSVIKNNGELLSVCEESMTVKVPIEQFESYKKNYNPQLWVKVSRGRWECGEAGDWSVDKKTGIATYKEDNYWGIVYSRYGKANQELHAA